MKIRRTRIAAGMVACAGTILLCAIAHIAVAQDIASLPYMDPKLSPEQRASDLVLRMTLAEKATQMQNNSAAIVDAWYPGEEGGAAVAETLSGKNNPAGRLPVTFYTGVSQLPNFVSIPTRALAAGEPVSADVTVTNTGKLAGDEVVQLYLKLPPMKGAPRVALRGFQRIHLEPGANQKVHFELKDRDLGMVTEEGDPIITAGDYTVSIGGGQPYTGAP